MKFALIAACDDKRGIGIQNKLPWRLKADLKYFSDVTTSGTESDPVPEGTMNAVIMGRKTWESLPVKHRPLKGRLNIVLSRGGVMLSNDKMNTVLSEVCGDDEFPYLVNSLEEAIQKLSANKLVHNVFVIGGANVYTQAMNLPECEEVFLTRVLGEFQCDAFFPEIPSSFEKVSESELFEENGVKFRFEVYRKAT